MEINEILVFFDRCVRVRRIMRERSLKSQRMINVFHLISRRAKREIKSSLSGIRCQRPIGGRTGRNGNIIIAVIDQGHARGQRFYDLYIGQRLPQRPDRQRPCHRLVLVIDGPHSLFKAGGGIAGGAGRWSDPGAAAYGV